MGSPPRARGRDGHGVFFAPLFGITPACAGKSSRWCRRIGSPRDHPRVRGEETLSTSASLTTWGSPPRARGRVSVVFELMIASRITPACAGKSIWKPGKMKSGRDHPRVRGEEIAAATGATGEEGSPPRARGRVVSFPLKFRARGITPACAGKSIVGVAAITVIWDHPRVRGEEKLNWKVGIGLEGSPPRARGRGLLYASYQLAVRITPACAGKSSASHFLRLSIWDHPRVRGEESSAARLAE